MNTKIRIAILTSVLTVTCLQSLFLQGCSGCANMSKEFQASTTGLHKHITLYANNGVIIREWTTTTDTDDRGGTCFFLTNQGKLVIVSGTFVVEEIP